MGWSGGGGGGFVEDDEVEALVETRLVNPADGRELLAGVAFLPRKNRGFGADIGRSGSPWRIDPTSLSEQRSLCSAAWCALPLSLLTIHIQHSHRMTQSVVIIGGGIIGTCTAYFTATLAKERGLDVAIKLVEGSSIAAGASGKAGGLLAVDWHGQSPLPRFRHFRKIDIIQPRSPFLPLYRTCYFFPRRTVLRPTRSTSERVLGKGKMGIPQTRHHLGFGRFEPPESLVKALKHEETQKRRPLPLVEP